MSKNIVKHAHKPTRGRKGFNPDVREKVISAAAIVIEQNGLGGLKARTIARRAAISVGSVYNLFGGLDDLIRIVNGRTYDDLHKAITQALEKSQTGGDSPRQQMLALAAAYLEFVRTHQMRWQSVLAFNRARKETPPTWYLQKELDLLGIIENAVTPFPGVKDAEHKALIARALWASIHGIVTIAVADGFHMQPLDTVSKQIHLIVTAVAISLEVEAA